VSRATSETIRRHLFQIECLENSKIETLIFEVTEKRRNIAALQFLLAQKVVSTIFMTSLDFKNAATPHTSSKASCPSRFLQNISIIIHILIWYLYTSP